MKLNSINRQLRRINRQVKCHTETIDAIIHNLARLTRQVVAMSGRIDGYMASKGLRRNREVGTYGERQQRFDRFCRTTDRSACPVNRLRKHTRFGSQKSCLAIWEDMNYEGVPNGR